MVESSGAPRAHQVKIAHYFQYHLDLKCNLYLLIKLEVRSVANVNVMESSRLSLDLEEGCYLNVHQCVD